MKGQLKNHTTNIKTMKREENLLQEKKQFTKLIQETLAD